MALIIWKPQHMDFKDFIHFDDLKIQTIGCCDFKYFKDLKWPTKGLQNFWNVLLIWKARRLDFQYFIDFMNLQCPTFRFKRSYGFQWFEGPGVLILWILKIRRILTTWQTILLVLIVLICNFKNSQTGL